MSAVDPPAPGADRVGATPATVDREHPAVEAAVVRIQDFGDEELAALIDRLRTSQEGAGEMQRLLHELQVHQIELEAQNRELREAQQALEASRDRYAELYDFAPVGYLTLDARGTVHELNLTAAELLGGERARLTGISVGHRVASEDRSRFYAHLRAVFASLERQECELRLDRPEGNEVAVSLRSLATGGESAELGRCRTIITDITEHRQAEAERTRLQRELEQARKTEAIGQLVGGVAHDFNNVLAVVLGNAALALRDIDQARLCDLQRHCKAIEHAGERARDLIARLLQFSRGGKLEARLLDVTAVAREATLMLRPLLPSSIEIALSTATGCPPVRADPSQLQQLLVNLTINARDAVGGKGRIVIRVAPCTALDEECAVCHRRIEGEWVEITVSDDGGGISSEHRDRIFDPFFTTKSAATGTGLGLAVVRGVVESLGGHVLVESEPGLGSSFHLLLRPQSGTVHPSGPRLRAATAAPAGGGSPGRRVLVVDDEAFIAELVTEFLENAGYRVSTFTDSEAALEAVRAAPGRFDAVVTDQTMPGLTGIELARAIHGVAPRLPVLLCTGYSEAIDAASGGHVGVDDYLEKPARLPELIARVEALLARAPPEPGHGGE